VTLTAGWPTVATEDEAREALAGVRPALDALALAAAAYGTLATAGGADDGELAMLAIELHDYVIAASATQHQALRALLRLAAAKERA
jgi:hypothetical protein